VAGFDFTVRCKLATRDVYSALLRYATIIARNMECVFHYEWQNSNGYYVTVDGSLRSFQALAFALHDALPAFAGGYASDCNQSALRRCGKIIAQAYTKRLATVTIDFHDFADQLSKGIGQTLTFSSYWLDVGERSHLMAKCRDFLYASQAYHRGRLPPSHFAEEAHTIVELLLKEALQPLHENFSFEGLTKLAEEQMLINSEQSKALINLKNLRRDSKHRGQSVPLAKMDKLFPRVLDACQALAARIRSKGPNIAST